MNKDDKFYIALLKRNGKMYGHAWRTTEPDGAIADDFADLHDVDDSQAPRGDGREFGTLSRDFAATMQSYRGFLSLLVDVASLISQRHAEDRIGEFAETKGRQRTDLSNDNATVYELALSDYPEFSELNHDVRASRRGANSLPQVILIGLLSAYDAFLSDLLRLVLSKHQEIVLTSEKEIKFSELIEFSSIEDARRSLIDREIDSVMRESHQKQFSWMEAKFKIALTQDLPSWPKFIELCERRNLFTHTGGIVTDQYMKNCKTNGCEISDIVAGQKLDVGPKYFSSAISIVTEIGLKLVHVLWRKFAKSEREEADEDLSGLAFDLIRDREYALAENILRFATKTIKKHSSEEIRLRMVVNLANAVRLQKREDEAKKILDAEDWTAASDTFRVCVAAVGGSKSDMLEIMKRIGPNGRPSASEYRKWPVFRGMRTDPEFRQTFESIFSEPLVSSGKIELGDQSKVAIEDQATTKPPNSPLH